MLRLASRPLLSPGEARWPRRPWTQRPLGAAPKAQEKTDRYVGGSGQEQRVRPRAQGRPQQGRAERHIGRYGHDHSGRFSNVD